MPQAGLLEVETSQEGLRITRTVDSIAPELLAQHGIENALHLDVMCAAFSHRPRISEVVPCQSGPASARFP